MNSTRTLYHAMASSSVAPVNSLCWVDSTLPSLLPPYTIGPILPRFVLDLNASHVGYTVPLLCFDDQPKRSPPPAGSATAAARAAAQRGDDSCVAPAALRAVLASLKTGGMTGAEKAKLKADRKLAEKDAEDRKAAEGMSAEVTRFGQDRLTCLTWTARFFLVCAVILV